MKNASPNRAEIARALSVFISPQQVTELRALGVPRGAGRPITVTGYFNDLQKMAAEAARLSQNGAKGVYFIPNPVRPALLARAENKVNIGGSGTSTHDSDIASRQWLFIDLDPIRPSGISATESERKATFQMLSQIVKTLTSLGWPEPVVADSGNGGHLLYRINLPTKDEGLIEKVLHALSFRFDNKHVQVDRKVFNPSRIWKLYGTVSRKGDSTLDRPHRVARIAKVPDSLDVVPKKLLQQLAKMVPVSEKTKVDPRLKTGREKLVLWIHKSGLDVGDPQPWGDKGRKWVFNECPWDPAHTDGSAYIVQLNSGAIAAGCHHEECKGKKNGWKKLQEVYGKLLKDKKDKDSSTSFQPSTVEAPGMTDSGNAKRIFRMFHDRVRHVTDWGQWLIYDGARWQRDTTNEILQMSFTALSTIYSDAVSEPDESKQKALYKWATRSESLPSRRNAVNLCAVEKGIAITPNGLDLDKWKLNLKNGTIDLKTGELLPHNRDDLITKMAPIKFDAAATCPRWEEFLSQVLGEDEETIEYVQKFIGYSMTGEVTEQVLGFLHGTGANGKSTFLGILQKLFGDYSRQAAPELLVQKKGGDHPTAVADLKGARFVVSTEIERGRGLAEVLVKQLTGGDTMKARFMRQDFFEFEPTHKIFLAANHKPIIRGNDEAIWRRIRLIPFEITIPPEERDHQLPEKLAAELPGILNWALEGCLKWQKQGLQESQAVSQATAAYRGEMDMLSDFLAECCEDDSSEVVIVKDLYETYLGWCEENNERTVTKRLFGMMLMERGYKQGRNRKARYWEGLRLKKSMYAMSKIKPFGNGVMVEA